jgi:hypothetical protein
MERKLMEVETMIENRYEQLLSRNSRWKQFIYWLYAFYYQFVKTLFSFWSILYQKTNYKLAQIQRPTK